MQWIQDLRYAMRQFGRNPGFTATAVLTLALGIGATTAIFTLIYNALLKSMPVRNASTLYMIGKVPTCCNYNSLQSEGWRIFSLDLYRYFRDHTQGFESITAFGSSKTALLTRRPGDPRAAETLQGRWVLGNEFSTLGVPVALGRAIQPSDDTEGAPPVAVLSDRAWDRHFGRDPHIIGSTLTMNGVSATVIGVTAPGYQGEIVQADPPELWLPVMQETKFVGEDASHLHRPDMHWLDVVGRLAPGASVSQINAQLNIELKQWLHERGPVLSTEERAQIDRQHTELSSVRSGVNTIARNYARSLDLLMGAAAFVLLIVCANVANLLLVRATAQRQQQAVRIALGASRRMLVRQALLQGVLLALMGSVGAILIAYVAAHSILALAFRGASYVPVNVTPSLPVLAFAVGVSLITALLFSLAPAWLATRTDPAQAMRSSTRSTTDASSTPQRLLVILQAALSVVLLCAAGLLLRSLDNLQKQEFGFVTKDRYIIGIDPFLAGYKPEQTDDLYRKLNARMMAIPGAQAVGFALYSPMSGNNWGWSVFIPGQPDPQPDSDWYNVSYTRVSPGYFSAIGARLHAGRVITDADDEHTRKVAVVNQSFADRYFHGHAIGQHFGVEKQDRAQFEIVGVVENTKYFDPTLPAAPMYFAPFSQQTHWSDPEHDKGDSTSHYAGQVVFAVNSSSTATVEAAVRRAFSEVNPNLVPQNFSTFAEQVATQFNQDQLLARLTSLFGLVALVLASVGIYGVTAYSVERRTGEIGIRMALGADRHRILRDVLSHAMSHCILGLVIGIPLAYGAGRLLAQHLYGVAAFDVPVSGATLLVLGLAGLFAALIPARRAASIEPMTALRSE